MLQNIAHTLLHANYISAFPQVLPGAGSACGFALSCLTADADTPVTFAKLNGSLHALGYDEWRVCNVFLLTCLESFSETTFVGFRVPALEESEDIVRDTIDERREPMRTLWIADARTSAKRRSKRFHISVCL